MCRDRRCSTPPPRRSERSAHDSRFGIGEPANNEQPCRAGLIIIQLNDKPLLKPKYRTSLLYYALPKANQRQR